MRKNDSNFLNLFYCYQTILHLEKGSQSFEKLDRLAKRYFHNYCIMLSDVVNAYIFTSTGTITFKCADPLILGVTVSTNATSIFSFLHFNQTENIRK